jgi:uncharacterized protein YndB with AHSA1/START domain
VSRCRRSPPAPTQPHPRASAGRSLHGLVAADAHLDLPPERVFAFLADLRNHWRLTPRFAELESLDGDAAGARVRIRGPLGLSRVARTRVLEAQEPLLLRGRAEVGRGTVGSVRWTIEREGEGSRVAISAEVERASPLDRAILALGGRRFLRRGFAQALEELGRVA